MPRSRTQPEPPEFFIDRSLGRHLLPDALRQAGFTAHTLASVYGEERAQEVSDEEWIALAGERCWVVLTKDDAIRRREAELAAVEEHAVKMFCLTNAGLRGEEQRERFLTKHPPHRPATAKAWPVDLRRLREADRPDMARSKGK